jgi:hypothetical protein
MRMRFIRPQAWTGLLLNIAMVTVMFLGVTYGDFSAQPEPVQQLMAELAASDSFYLTYAGFLALQGLGLFLIANKSRIGIVVAVVSSFSLLPFSIVYLMGCFSSYYSIKYAALPPAPSPDSARGVRGREFKSGRQPTLVILFCVGGALTLFMLSGTGLSPFFVLLLSFTLICGYLAYRSGTVPALTLYNDFFVIRPHLMAQPAAIAYKNVHSATLLADNSIRLEVLAPNETMTLHWLLPGVAQEDQKAALEAFGGALVDNGVTLY